MTFKPMIHVVDQDATTRFTLSELFRSADLNHRYHDSAEGFLQSPERTLPGCILLELELADMSGLDLQARIARKGYRPPVIFLAAHGDVPAAVRAMRGGAIDFLVKPIAGDRVLKDVRRAIALDFKRRRKAARRATVRARLELLTRREHQVLDAVVAGSSNKEIGRDLGISHKTVELHRSNMMAKLHADSIAHLVRFAMDGAAVTSRSHDGWEPRPPAARGESPAATPPAAAQAASSLESLHGAPR